MKSRSGFTIVELLIVIVVIAILAAISIVAYNGVQARTKFTRALNDIKQTQKLVELYYADKGVYPLSASWSPQSSGNQNTYITGLVPDFAGSLPIVTDGSGAYYYRTNATGTEYKVMKYKAVANGAIASDEWSNVPASMKDGTTSAANQERYGVWSSGGQSL